MRSYLLFFIGCITVISIALTIRFGQNSSQAKEDLNRERYLRLTTEENLEKAKTKISSLETELARIQNKVKNIERSLDETTAVNKDLKVKLDKTSGVKEDLEKKVKELEQMTTQELPGTEKTDGAI